MICPACKNSSSVLIDSVNVNQEFTKDILPATYKILKCKICNLNFKDYIPDQGTLNTFYNSLGNDLWDYKETYPHELYIKKILQRLPDGSNVLDVGCNTGRLLQEEVNRLNCFGIELNNEAAKIAAGKGIKILKEEIMGNNLTTHNFEIITLIDVFEHLNDPLPFIEKLIGALNPGGRLYIFTGRNDCFPALICGSHYWYYKPAQHLIFLNNEFIKWYKKNNRCVSVSVKPMRHFNFSWKKLVYQMSWHLVWRFFSPNSPYRIFEMERFRRMKEPFMITSWKDHVFFIIEKK